MKRLFRFSSGRAGAVRDVKDELRFHIDARAQEFIAQGMSPEEAQRAARRAFGDLSAIEAEVRGNRIAYVERTERRDWLGALTMDIGYALRALRKNPGFTAAVVATLTLGIGATVAVFTIVNGVLLRPFPYKDPSRLAMVWLAGPEDGGGATLPLTTGYFANLNDDASSPVDAAAFRSWTYTGATSGAAEEVRGARVTFKFFDVLGVLPMLGRTFSDTNDAKVAVLSHGFWERRFGGAKDIVGKPVTLSGETFTIIGVMPPGFAFPRGAELPAGFQFAPRTDIWTPLIISEGDRRNFGTMNLSGVARLKPGVQRLQAEATMTARLHELLRTFNTRTQMDYRLITLKDQASTTVRRSLLVLMGAVAFVLLIACANVANLLIGRTASRSREFAVRAALGAGRGRIARQLITENVVLAGTGTILGVLLSVWAVRAMLSLVPSGMPRADDVHVDWRVIALAVGVAFACGVAFALAAALHLRRANIGTTLQHSTGRVAGGRRRIGRRGLVAAEIALSLMLLIGAVQLTLSFIRLERVDPGFDPSNAITASVRMPLPNGFRPILDGPKYQQFYRQLMDRLRQAPGVKAAGGSSVLPLTGQDEWSSVTIVGQTPPPNGRGLRTIYGVVDGDFFGAMGIRVLSGRGFDERDVTDGTPAIVVNRAFAKAYFGAANPIGQQLNPRFEFRADPPARTIIGVVEDAHQAGLGEATTPQVYVPESQLPYPFMNVVVRSAGTDARTLIPALKNAVGAIDPNVAVAQVRELEDLVGTSVARQRFSMSVIVIFAAASLLLAVVGLYGVIALSVRQRKRELGVRMALGANARDVVTLVLREGVWVSAIGVAVGAVGAIALARVLTSMLFEAKPADPAVIAGAAVAVALVSLVATYVPARRAVQVDPTAALRAD
ncbi:MAG TPA: ABC transporter permease [Gemmatimonadaceae bacterium]|nr:ABC transporter permease [Gemmatimonadaceae bacterium]